MRILASLSALSLLICGCFEREEAVTPDPRQSLKPSLTRTTSAVSDLLPTVTPGIGSEEMPDGTTHYTVESYSSISSTDTETTTSSTSTYTESSTQSTTEPVDVALLESVFTKGFHEVSVETLRSLFDLTAVSTGEVYNVAHRRLFHFEWNVKGFKHDNPKLVLDTSAEIADWVLTYRGLRRFITSITEPGADMRMWISELVRRLDQLREVWFRVNEDLRNRMFSFMDHSTKTMPDRVVKLLESLTRIPKSAIDAEAQFAEALKRFMRDGIEWIVESARVNRFCDPHLEGAITIQVSLAYLKWSGWAVALRPDQELMRNEVHQAIDCFKYLRAYITSQKTAASILLDGKSGKSFDVMKQEIMKSSFDEVVMPPSFRADLESDFRKRASDEVGEYFEILYHSRDLLSVHSGL